MKRLPLCLFAVASVFVAGCSGTGSTERALAGTWRSGETYPLAGLTNRAVYEFRRDGTYSYSSYSSYSSNTLPMPFPRKARKHDGTYSVESWNLLVLDGRRAMPFFIKSNTLNIVIFSPEERIIRYMRTCN
jgi:hypothetical protein